MQSLNLSITQLDVNNNKSMFSNSSVPKFRFALYDIKEQLKGFPQHSSNVAGVIISKLVDSNPAHSVQSLYRKISEPNMDHS